MTLLWRVEMFGALRARAVSGEGPTHTRFRTQKTAALLAYLALKPGPQPREVLCGLLWPDSEPEAARNSLSASLSSLRRQLEGGQPAGSVILADRLSVGLNQSAFISDVAEFSRAQKKADGAPDDAARIEALSQAVEIYTGPLLPGFYDEWAVTEARCREEEFIAATGDLLDLLEDAVLWERVVASSRRGLGLHPDQEAWHLSAMRAYLALGRPAAATRQFEELKQILAREGNYPSARAQKLAAQAQAGQQVLATTPHAQPEATDPAPAPSQTASISEEPSVQVLAPQLATSVRSGPQTQVPEGPAMPSGTVVFLMADCPAEEQLCVRMAREIEEREGHPLRVAPSHGLWVFGRASDALSAAVAIQTSLMSSAPEERPRMALCAGEVERVRGDFRGAAAERVRLLFPGANPGQILMCEATASMARRSGPNDPLALGESTLRELGAFKLGDASEKLFQADYAGAGPLAPPRLTPQAPEARSATGALLPSTFTRFFGRRLEITQIHRLLREDGARLVTLTGPGGSGKTRLSLEVAGALAKGPEPWRDLVAFVPLADLSDEAFVFTAIRDALKVPPAPNASPLDQVVETLSAQPSLLLLDNFEQLVEAGAPLVQELLERLPELSVLVTSRQVLGLPGEREYPVAPLPVPGEDASPERLKECSGTALFIDRAQAARVDFRVDERNARQVAAICRRLDGIPLALELAAARSLVLSPAQMLEKLRTSFDLLSTRQRGVPERHRTLRAAIAWSYGLLSSELQHFFARLSVFRGGWTFEAAEEVCQEPEALDFLSRLRECSLVVTEERAGETRFRMLETLREYALEQLEKQERAEAESRYCKYFVVLAEESEPHLRGPEQAAYLEWLEGEQDNFRAVLAWALDHDTAGALRLSAALAPFWETRGHYAEGRAWIEQALARTISTAAPSAAASSSSVSSPSVSSTPWDSGGAEEGESALAQARALHMAGRFAWFESDMSAAAARLEESLALFRAQDDVAGALEATSSLIMTRAWQGDERAALSLVREGMELRDRISARAAAMPALAAFACAVVFVASESVVPQAREVSEEVAALARAAGDKKSEGVALACLGGCFHWEGKWQEALGPHRASLDPLAEIGEGWMSGYALWGLGRAELALGHVEEALRCTEESLRLQTGHRSPLGQPFCLDSCAMIAFAQGRLERSARLFGAAEANRERFGIALMPLMAARNLPYAQALRETLGPQVFGELWDEGRALSTEEARDYALERDAEKEQVLEAPEVLAGDASLSGALAKASALCSAGRLAWFEGNYNAARERLEEGLSLLRAAGDEAGALSAISSLIMVVAWQGEREAAARLVQEGRAILGRLSHSVSERSALLPVLSAFGWAILFVASPETQEDSRAVNEEVVGLARQAGDKRSEGIALACLGGYFFWRGEFDTAREHYAASVPLLREVGDPMMVPHALWGLARIAIQKGQLDQARRLMTQTLQEQLQTRSPVGTPYALEACAAIAVGSDPALAACLFGAADALRQKQRAVAQALTVEENRPFLNEARRSLGEGAFQAAWDNGRTLSPKQACELALKSVSRSQPQSPDSPSAPEVLEDAQAWAFGAAAGGDKAPRVPAGRAGALCSAGRLAWFSGDFATARARLEEGLELLQAQGDGPGTVGAMSSLIMVLAWQGEEERALSLVRESREIAGRIRDRAGLLPVLAAQGYAFHALASARAQDEARLACEEVVLLARAAGDSRNLAVAQACLGQHAYWAGDFGRARAFFEASVAPLHELGDAYMESHSLWGLGRVAIAQGRFDEAYRLSRQSIELRQGHTSHIGLPYMIESFALLASAQGQNERAVCLFASAAHIRESQGCFAQSLVVAENSRHLQSLRAGLGEAAFQRAWCEGRDLTTEEAFDLALEEPVTPQVRDAPRQGMAWQAHDAEVGLPSPARANALCSAGRLAWFEGDFATARARLEEGLALLRASNDAPGALSAMSSLVMVLSWQGEEEAALSLVREGVALLNRIPDRARLLPLLSTFGWATFFAAADDAQDDSRVVNEEVARLAREVGDKRSLGVALACLGGHFYWRARWEEARAAYEEAVPLLREVEDHLMVPHALWGLGRVAVRQGRFEEARLLMEESLRLQINSQSPIGFPYTIEGFAQVASASEPARMVTLFAAATAMRAAQHAHPQSLVTAENSKYLQQAREAMEQSAFDAAWEKGRAMTLEQACAFALGDEEPA